MSVLSETAATLRVLGDDLEPASITKLLDREPTEARRKGDEIPLKTGQGLRTARTGSWCIRVPRTRPGDLDSQIGEILAGTTNDLEAWSSLARRYKVEIFCGLFLVEFNEGLEISSETIRSLGQRGISLDFDIYFQGHA